MVFKKVVSNILLVSFIVAPNLNLYAESYRASRARVNNLPRPRELPKKFHNLNKCELNFVSFVQGQLPAELTGNTALNLWDDLFDSRLMVEHIKTLKAGERVEYLAELVKWSSNNDVYAKNLADVVSDLVAAKHVNISDVKRIFVNDGPINDTKYFWSKASKKLTAQVEIDPEKVELVREFIAKTKLGRNTKNEYKRILLQSKFTKKQVQMAIDNGLEFKRGTKYIEQFELYVEYLENLPKGKIKRGLKNIQQIYNFNFTPGRMDWASLSPQKKFLIGQYKNKKFVDKRFIEIFNDMKLKERHAVISEIDDLVRRQKAGEAIDPRERARLYKKLDDIELPASLRQRAMLQAVGEGKILRRLRNGCASGDSPVLRQTAKRFSRFKFALAMTSTPLFYYLKNKDKLGQDPYWFERLGYEMAMGVAFTFVANKIFTNGQTSAWNKFIRGYIQFGALDMINAYGYEKLFGAEAMIRHLQKVYQPNIGDSQLDKEYQELVSGPDVEKNIQELLEFLEERSKDRNTKNFVEKYLHLGPYNQLEDEDKITIKDMESPEGKELLMELLAERLYLQNMGNHPLFQTGSHGGDRWSFYRARNSVFDIKSLALNLAIFQIMCREPFGKAGSWMAVFGLVMANELLSGDFTYQWRRDAINQ